MKSLPLLGSALLLFHGGSASSADPEKFYLAAGETEALVAKEGQKVVVHGHSKGSGKSASGTNFVRFEGADFFVLTFKSDLGQFPDGEPADLYEGKRLAIEGTITLYQGKPQIKLTDPGQVTVLAPDAVFPPPAQKEEKADADKPMTEAPAPPSPAAPAPPTRKPPVDPSEYFKKKG